MIGEREQYSVARGLGVITVGVTIEPGFAAALSVCPYAHGLPRQHGPPEGGVSDCTTRRAVSTQLVGNPVCAHYRHHVTPGVCRREGTLRRGFPRPEPRLVGSQARQPSAERWAPLEPGGFPLIAWLARARAFPLSQGTRAGAAVCGGARDRENAARGR